MQGGTGYVTYTDKTIRDTASGSDTMNWNLSAGSLLLLHCSNMTHIAVITSIDRDSYREVLKAVAQEIQFDR